MDLATLWRTVTGLQIKVAEIATTVSWLEWWMKLLVVGTVGNVVIGGINLRFSYKNHKNNNHGKS